MRLKQGITLIELLVVIALIMIFSYLTVSRVSFSQLYVRTEVDLLRQVCLYLQRHAMVTHTSQLLQFDLQSHSYTFDGRRHQLCKGVEFGIIPAKGPPSEQNKPLTHVCTFKDNSIVFHPDGIISSGSIYITNDQHTVLYALTNAVSSYSYLRTYCYADTWRLLE